MKLVVIAFGGRNIKRLNITQSRWKCLLTCNIFLEELTILLLFLIHGKNQNVVIDFAFADIKLFIAFIHLL